VADILSHHVKLSVEGIDPMYLNIDVPQLQREQGIVWFFPGHRGLPVPSAAVMRLRERCRLDARLADHAQPWTNHHFLKCNLVVLVKCNPVSPLREMEFL
jgi:hypothetical protein